MAAKAIYMLGHADGCDLDMRGADEETHALWAQLLHWLFALHIPTMMALHGRVNGTGMALALACSKVVVVQGARLKVPDSNLEFWR